MRVLVYVCVCVNVYVCVCVCMFECVGRGHVVSASHENFGPSGLHPLRPPSLLPGFGAGGWAPQALWCFLSWGALFLKFGLEGWDLRAH